MSADLNSKLNILCLHGNLQSAGVFRSKIGRLPHKLKNIASLFFAEAPLLLPRRLDDDTSLQTWYYRENNTVDISSLESSLGYLEKVWHHDGPFHGILGFSMGGSMAALMATLPERFSGIKFVVLVAAAAIQSSIVPIPYQIPDGIKCFSIIGLTDKIVLPERSRQLTNFFRNAIICEHDQGHCFPSKSAVIDKLIEFLMDMKKQIFSLSLSDNTPSSSNMIALSNETKNANNDIKMPKDNTISETKSPFIESIDTVGNSIMICSSLDNLSQQAEEIEALMAIFMDEIAIKTPLPVCLNDPCVVLSYRLNPLNPNPPLPTSWTSCLSLEFTFPSKYPTLAPPKIDLHTGNLSMMEFSYNVRMSLLHVVRACADTMIGYPVVMECIQSANDWLSTGCWQHVNKVELPQSLHTIASEAQGNNEHLVNGGDRRKEGTKDTLPAEYRNILLSSLIGGEHPEEWNDDMLETQLINEATEESCRVAAEARAGHASDMLSRFHDSDALPQPTTDEGAHLASSGTEAAYSTASSKGIWKYTVGLVGKPSAGKSTVYNAATKALLERDGRLLAAVAPHPFTTIDPNIGPGWYAGPADAIPHTDTADRVGWHGHTSDGRRLLPIIIKDVAGLVPGAYKGRGKGNKFLSDLCDADVLIHVVDATGRADRDGNEVIGQGSTPTEDAKWIREELHRWIHGNVLAKWDSVTRKIRDKSKASERVLALFSGYQGPRALTLLAVERANLDLDNTQFWTRLDLHRLVAHYLSLRFPVCLALNKVDALPLDESGFTIVRDCQKEAFARGEVAVPVSARAENWVLWNELKHLKCNEVNMTESVSDQKDVGARTAPGHSSPLNETEENNILHNVMKSWGRTGVLEAVSAAVALKSPVYCYVVSDLESETPLGWTAGTTADGTLFGLPAFPEGNRVPKLLDCLQLKPGSTVGDVVESLKYGALPHIVVTGTFVRAEGRAVDRNSRKKQLGRDSVIDAATAVLKLQMNRKILWRGLT